MIFHGNEQDAVTRSERLLAEALDVVCGLVAELHIGTYARLQSIMSQLEDEVGELPLWRANHERSVAERARQVEQRAAAERKRAEREADEQANYQRLIREAAEYERRFVEQHNMQLRPR